MKRLSFIVLSILFTFPVMAQNQKGKSLGDFVHLTKKNQSFTFKTTYGTARVVVYSPGMMKISVWKGQEEQLPSYAVVMQPEKTNISMKENKKDFILTTDSLSLEISKSPLRFTFKTLDGKIINQDDPMGSYWLDGKMFTFKKLFKDEKFIGLGEKTGNLNRRDNDYTNWNTDNPHYEDWSDPLYSTIPFYIGIHNNLPYGIFVDNSTKSNFNFGAGNDRMAYFSVNDHQTDYYFIFHRDVKNIIGSYTALTGRMPMPPIWGLGFQQSRWSYTPDKEVMEVAQTFRDKQIPLDVLYLDIGYMNAYKVFTWNPTAFPHPKKLISSLKNMGIHTAVIVDPGVKVEKGYSVYEEGLKNHYFIQYPDGSNYTGEVWPGWCNFPDFTNPKVRTWWGTQFQGLVDDGVTGFWNDMNEIAVWGKDVPPIIQMDWEGKGVSYLKGKNVFGMQMARSTFQGVKKLLNDHRPLVLTRSGYAGLQRYTAIWTGDNQATDDHMLLGVRLVNSFGLSGVAYAGYDAGGFGGDASPDLYARWVSIASFAPFFRVHSSIDTRRSEPWSYGESTEAVAARFIRLRYHLLPYTYSTFYQAHKTGLPVQRSLSIEYTDDQEIYNPEFDNQYLFGPSFLIIPAKSTEMSIKAYFPEGNWYLFYTDQKITGPKQKLVPSPLNELPVYVKAGAIIPVQKLIENTGENPGDTLEIHVYNGNVDNSFQYYEDDGNTYNYQEGNFYIRNILFNGKKKELILDTPEGTYSTRFHYIRIVFHGFTEKDQKQLKANEGSVPVNTNGKSLFLSRYQQTAQDVFSITLPNNSQKSIITW